VGKYAYCVFSNSHFETDCGFCAPVGRAKSAIGECKLALAKLVLPDLHIEKTRAVSRLSRSTFTIKIIGPVMTAHADAFARPLQQHYWKFAIAMLPKEELLKGVENRETAARVVDQAEQAIKTWDVVCTDFLSPPELAEVEQMFKRLTEVQLLIWGGYPQAERQRAAIARSELPLEQSQVAIAALDISGNFLFDPASHRDFLGALLGTGIVRDKVGDIIVLGERGAQAIVIPELVEFLEMQLTQVRSVPVKTRRIELSELKIREPKKKELTTVEASLRLDAIASAGFGMSRSKMADLITGGDVRVNWKEITQSSHQLKAGDLVAIRGKGRLEVGEIAVTKKDRYRVQLTRLM
jgi:photosystem II S4 domain protein